jgi:hypothetical protein
MQASPMDVRPSLLPETRRLLKLAREDEAAAERAVAALSLEAQTNLVCEAPPSHRHKLLALAPEPAAVIPLIPVAELCFTVKALGLWDASWILEHATSEQIVACFDLDAWSDLTPDREALETWLAALAEAGEEPLLRAVQSLDPELIVLYLRDRIDVHLISKDQSLEVPEGAQTLEGQFYVVPKKAGDDVATVLRLLDALFRNDYWLYFRMLQGVSWELESELEEWALRWRTGRMEDLGFPPWDEAMRIYGYLRPGERSRIPQDIHPLDVREWHLPVWMPELPVAAESRYSLFRAAAELEADERRAFFYSFVAIANKVAVADALDLGDSETLQGAIDKAASRASRGLEHLALENGLQLPDVLRRVTLERLFRVGTSLGEVEPGIPDRGSHERAP